MRSKGEHFHKRLDFENNSFSARRRANESCASQMRKQSYLHGCILACFGGTVACVTSEMLREDMRRSAVDLLLIRTPTVMPL